jgi:TolB-like protein
MSTPTSPHGELIALVGGLSSVRLDEYAVVGSYMRFDERVRQRLKDARLRIADACQQPARRRDNHLVWAAPGSGKTYLVEQVAASLADVGYRELNLARLSEEGFRSGLERAVGGGPQVCLVDEVDAKPEAPWPYELLLPFLDVNLERGGGVVFVLAGSSGGTIEEFKERLAARPKGRDVLSRVPESNEWEIPRMGPGDRMLVALRQMLDAATEIGRHVAAVEKLALYYVAAAPHLGNARQLREFAVRAVERGSTTDDRIRYDDLFDSGDPDNKRFWAGAMPAAEELETTFVRIVTEDDRKPASSGGTAVRAAGISRSRVAEPEASFAGSPEREGSGESVAALSLPAKPSIAVLPFSNMSGDAEQEYFADGIAEDIITGLSRVSWLFVIARNSSFTYKGRNVDVRQIGRELGVRYVLEGSVRTSGNRMRTTAQLVEAETGSHLWAERYDRACEDVFAVQDEITESVLGSIQPEVYAAEHERVRRKPPQSLDAWESFIRAMFLYSEHSDTSTRKALALLDAAVDLDPTYAQAHGLRGVCLVWRMFQGWEERGTSVEEATKAALRGVECDSDEPWVSLAQGFIAIAGLRDADAVAAFGRAVDVSPNFAYAHGLLGAAHAFGGRAAEAIESIDHAVRLSPRDIFWDEFRLYYAFAHFQAGRYADAAAAAEAAVRKRPGHAVPWIIATAAHALDGATERAGELASQVMTLVPTISVQELEDHFLFPRVEDRRRLATGLRSAGLPE